MNVMMISSCYSEQKYYSEIGPSSNGMEQRKSKSELCSEGTWRRNF